MTLHIRFRSPDGVRSATVDGGVVRCEDGETFELLDPDTLALAPPYELVSPVEPPEIWCAGVTYARSRNARIEESGSDAYALVYNAARPELFLKDAGMRRTVGPGAQIGIRADSAWNVPEPELALVLGQRGEIAGVTIGNDVSSRDIEGANLLYLPQAKVYAGACALGPALLVDGRLDEPFTIRLRILKGAKIVFEGETSTARMRRSFHELIDWLLRDNPVPPGSVLLTGTGLVPPDDFTLESGHRVEIHVPGIGTLVNDVTRASNLLERTNIDG